MNQNPRPSIDPLILSSMLSAAPERLQKRLDREPKAADGWEWRHEAGQWNVQAGEETVQVLAELVTEFGHVRCSCLLSPRCFHVLAVLNVCGIVESSFEAADTASADELPALSGAEETSGKTGSGVIEPAEELTTNAIHAAQQMDDATSRILATGLRSCGAVQQSQLLRAIHECRSEGLHRLAAAGLRLMTDIRQLRDHDENFRSETAVEDFRELLETCRHVVRQSPTPIRWIGVARRQFVPVESQKLHALFCEPILTRSGYAGVVTWLMADDGWIGSVSDVQPGDASRIPQAWQSGVTLAGLSLSHRALSQKCLLLSKGTRSADGRLGGGESARAVPVDGKGWNAGPVAAKFQTPLADQIRQSFNESDKPDFMKPAGSDLLFFEAIVLGYHEHELIVAVPNSDVILSLTIALADDELSFRDSLTTLACAPGLKIRCIGRIERANAGRIQLLACSPASHELGSQAEVPEGEVAERPKLMLSNGETHRSIGLHRLEKTQLSRCEKWPVRVTMVPRPIAAASADESLERWLRAIATGGRHAIPQTLAGSAARDVVKLRSQSRTDAATLLGSLTSATMATTTDIRGVRTADVPQQLAARWLAAAICSRTTLRELQLHDWMALVHET
ncbi:MAG: hypothetical protein JNM43_23260 [Planctomycetaceae bacterium]|nr:hypothetical protein [Planctomycetaceae bacterium]